MTRAASCAAHCLPDASHAAQNLALSALVEQSIQGQRHANGLIADLRDSVADQDALHDRVRAVMANGERETLRSMLRVVQKALERAV